MLVCGYESNVNSLEVLEEALEVQAGNKAGILKGRYATKLKKVPAAAVGVIMGDVPEELRRDMVRGGSGFKGIPKGIAAVMTRTKNIDIDCHGTMADADDAKAFAESVADVKKMAIHAVKRLPLQLRLKPQQVKLLIKALESITTEAEDDKVSGGVEITPKMVKVVYDTFVTPWLREQYP